MQQRVGLARAFATDADILLMDEPFSALDPLIRGKLQGELLALQERVKKTILFVSHDLDEALRLGDRISILQNGRIIQTGTAEDIVLAPADDYVAEFVRHMNPLDVLTGGMIMWQRTQMPAEGNTLWLDERRRYRLSLNGADEALALHVDGVEQPLRPRAGRRLARRHRTGPRGGRRPPFPCNRSSVCARRPGTRCCSPMPARSSACAARPRSSAPWPAAGIERRRGVPAQRVARSSFKYYDEDNITPSARLSRLPNGGCHESRRHHFLRRDRRRHQGHEEPALRDHSGGDRRNRHRRGAGGRRHRPHPRPGSGDAAHSAWRPGITARWSSASARARST